MGGELRLGEERVRLGDYYAGALGGRRLMRELDQFLQHVFDNVGSTESLTCAIELRIAGGESIRLDKTYRSPEPEEEPHQAS